MPHEAHRPIFCTPRLWPPTEANEPRAGWQSGPSSASACAMLTSQRQRDMCAVAVVHAFEERLEPGKSGKPKLTQLVRAGR